MVAQNEMDKLVFGEQRRLMEKERNMRKANIKPTEYGMRNLFEKTYVAPRQ